MANIIVNALSLRPGGGLQVVSGLLSRFSNDNTYTVLWSDPQSLSVMQNIVGARENVRFERPIQSQSALSVFKWQYFSLGKFAKENNADIVFSVNHHFPVGDISQVVYHLNVLRFDRPKGSIFSITEIADQLRDWRARAALKRAQANSFESKYLLDAAKKVNNKISNPSVSYIGLDDRRSIASRDDKEETKRPPHIIALTSPQPHKDNITLIRMLGILCDKRPDIDWRLKIAGGRSPEVFADLKSAAIELKVDRKIDWLGFCDHETLSEIGSNCLCLVSTSLVESFSMVALEAMSWGTPPIVCDTTSMPESVGNAGFLARPKDAGHFAELVGDLYNDDALHATYVKRGLARAKDMTWSSAAKQFEEMFKKLI